jgi:hypothetical protein
MTTCLNGARGGCDGACPLCAHDGRYLPEALHDDHNIAYIDAKLVRG